MEGLCLDVASPSVELFFHLHVIKSSNSEVTNNSVMHDFENGIEFGLLSPIVFHCQSRVHDLVGTKTKSQLRNYYWNHLVALFKCQQ